MSPSFVVVLAAFAASVLLTPLVVHFAFRFDLVDRPDGHRKLHGRTVPLGGGVAVLLGGIVAMLVAHLLTPGLTELLVHDQRFLLGLLGAAAMIVGLGLIDDRFELRGRQKLAGQALTVVCVVLSGVVIENVELFGYRLELGLLAVPLTVFWLLGCINALNLIDGVDGLATTVGVVISLSVAVMAFMTQHYVDTLCALAMAGSLAGFLVHNLPPARIFLGDAGSMLIGLVLGVLAIRSSLKGPATVALAAPTAVWAVLIFDVGMAIVRRKLTGQSLYTTDRGHLHHTLLKQGFSGQATVMMIGLLVSICSLGALASVYLKHEGTALLAVAAVLGTMVVTKLFGHAECRLLLQRLRNLVFSMVRLPYQPAHRKEPITSRFHGNRDWELMWTALVEFAERFDLCLIQLNVNSPSIHEEYHAMWERRGNSNLHRVWRTEVPLVVGRLVVGRLKIEGVSNESTTFDWMAELLEGLRPFELQMHELLEMESAQPVLPMPSLADAAPVAGVNASDVLSSLHADEALPAGV